MSVYDLFRGFFGVPGRRDPFFGGIAREEDEDEDEEEDGDGQGYPFGTRPHEGFGFSFGPGGSHFHGSFGFEDVFQDFNKPFTDVDKWMSRPLELPDAGEFPVGRERSLRDAMLKDPESDIPKSDKRSLEPEAKENPGFMSPERRLPWRPFGRFEDLWKAPPNTGKNGSREDKDLDSEVSSGSLDTVLRSPEPETKSYFKSVSVTKVMSPDGTIEEHRTVKDSQGKTETTVSHRKGDQVYERTTTKNERGAEEVTERMINMDDRDLAQFADGWKLKEGASTDMKDASSILDRFLRGFFTGR